MGGRPRAIVLLSGGLDSATTAALAIREGLEVHALTVRYGQRHEVEIGRAQALARALGVASHRVVDVDLSWMGGSALTDPGAPVPHPASEGEIGREIPPTYVPARNTVLLSLALAWAEVLGAEQILIGANAVDYSGYPDCRPEYLEAFQKMAELATRAGVEGGRIRIRAPLIAKSKAEIVRVAVELGVDLSLTLSCYDPSESGAPCGSCESCLLRARGFREAGLSDPGLPGGSGS